MATLPDDHVLVTGLRAGDQELFARLLDDWSSSMLRLARSFVSTHASAEEVVQGTWLAVLRGAIDAVLQTLPDRQRVVIVLRDLEGRSSDEVCDMLEISPGNQRVLPHRARAAVRGGLENYFASEGARS